MVACGITMLDARVNEEQPVHDENGCRKREHRMLQLHFQGPQSPAWPIGTSQSE